MSLIISILPFAIFLTFALVPSVAVIFLFKRRIRNKKSPLNMKLLRRPGQTLQLKIDELSDDILANVVSISAIPMAFYSGYITLVAFSEKAVRNTTMYIYLIVGAAFVILLSRDVYGKIKERNLLRLGYECETAVGQELSALASSSGFYIFHDFPADGFNIDHIAVGPQGVFAIETKGRAKNRKTEMGNWKVRFDGKKLIFPGWSEDEPVRQARRQASWLSKWLENSTGEKYKALPVLAIPGWWIDKTRRSDLAVYNGRNPCFLAKGPVVLNEKQIKSISFHVEKRCRDVESKAYPV